MLTLHRVSSIPHTAVAVNFYHLPPTFFSTALSLWNKKKALFMWVSGGRNPEGYLSLTLSLLHNFKSSPSGGCYVLHLQFRKPCTVLKSERCCMFICFQHQLLTLCICVFHSYFLNKNTRDKVKQERTHTAHFNRHMVHMKTTRK